MNRAPVGPELLRPVGIVEGWVHADRFVRPAVVFEVGLPISRDPVGADVDRPLQRLFADRGLEGTVGTGLPEPSGKSCPE